MLKRTLYFTNNYRLSLKDAQLVAEYKADGHIRTVPIEDIGFVVLDDMRITVSLPLLEALTANNVAVVFCNSTHHPQSMLLNLDGHSIQTELFREQINAGLPLKKNLWKQTIEAKISNQAALLSLLGQPSNTLLAYAANVKSGDTDNKEGAAARLYWPRIFGKNFTRERFGDFPNPLLNYGYAILRAAVARALTGSGLLPTLGIHHRNKYNAYCLADDIMEPYRPFVDRRVQALYIKNPNINEICKEHKAELMLIITDDVKIGKTRRPLMLALSQTTASLARCFAGEAKSITYPKLD